MHLTRTALRFGVTACGCWRFYSMAWSLSAASTFWMTANAPLVQLRSEKSDSLAQNPRKESTDMHISQLALTPLISLIAGVLILVMPRLLNYIVALYLIVVGLIGLFPHLSS